MKNKKLILVRHGQSKWNLENKFTGWYDVSLSTQGIIEAKKAGRMLKKENIKFNYCYTSLLYRSIKTMWTILEEMKLYWLNIEKNWKLNERHYGKLQGLNKLDVEKKYGKEQVSLWRRSFDVSPPILTDIHSTYSGFDKRYEKINKFIFPQTESLKDTLNRIILFYNEYIYKKIINNNNIIIVAHGNSIRALSKHIENLSDRQVEMLNIPTGIPIIYNFNHENKFVNKYNLF